MLLSADRLCRTAELQCQRTCINAEYEMMQKVKRCQGRELTYSNQQEAAQKVIQAYQEGKHLAILVAQPGAGKTGVILEVCRQLMTHIDDDMCVPRDNVRILSGMSDLQWKIDMQRNMMPRLKDNIHHRGEISKIETVFQKLNNAFVANDECQIACGDKMKMSKLFQKAAITNVDYAVSNSIRVLQVSATPDAVLWDLKAWGDKAQIVKLEPSPSYKGFRVMLTEERIRRPGTFTSIEDVRTFLQTWQNRYDGCPTKKYFPIRLLPNSTVLMGWIKTVAQQLGWNTFHNDSSERVESIDDDMKAAPNAHTIIFIKGFWRASKRIERRHVGGCFEEPPKNTNVTSTANGLIARFCNTYDYEGDELNHPEWRPLHFGDVDAINCYLNWFENDCDYKTNVYSSPSLKANGVGRVKSKHTMVHHSLVTGLNQNDVDAALAVGQIRFASPEHPTMEAADQWAINNINFEHSELGGNTCNGKPRRVLEYDSERKLRPQTGTHMKDRGELLPIPTLAEIRSQNIPQLGGGGVRLIPVRMGEDSPNKYIIIYRIQWLKPESRSIYHPAPAQQP